MPADVAASTAWVALPTWVKYKLARKTVWIPPTHLSFEKLSGGKSNTFVGWTVEGRSWRFLVLRAYSKKSPFWRQLHQI